MKFPRLCVACYAQNVEGRAVTKLGRIRKENEDQIIRDLVYQA